MRECEFFVQTTSGKTDCRGKSVEAVIDGVRRKITRKAQLARLERQYGELELYIDGEPARSAEGQHSRHLRETSVTDATFNLHADWRGVVQSLTGLHADKAVDALEQMDEAVRTGTWTEVQAHLGTARASWDEAVIEAVPELAHASSPFANRLRASGIEGRDADAIAYALVDFNGDDRSQRAAARAARAAIEANPDVRGGIKAARRAGFLCGGEREWADDSSGSGAWGVVPVGSLVLMAGPAGSGKSTHAKRLKASSLAANTAVVISTDGIRKELLGDEADQSRGDEVFKERDRRVRNAIRRGETTIVDATNLDKSVGRLVNYAKQEGRMVCVVRMDTPDSRVLSQNEQRQRVVPQDAVARHLERHATLDEKAWQQKGADVVLTVSDAAMIGDIPGEGCPLRPVGDAEIRELIELGVGRDAGDGTYILPVPYLARHGKQFVRTRESRARQGEGGQWELSRP